MTSVVNVRGDRLYHEHIAWDQATVLVQLGLMPEYLLCLTGEYPGLERFLNIECLLAGLKRRRS